MKPHEQALAARRRQRLLMGGIGIIALILLSIASLNSYRDLRAGRGQEAELSAGIAAIEGRIGRLEERVQRLREDPAMIEQLAREELMMARPGEVVVVLPASGSEEQAGAEEEPRAGTLGEGDARE